MTPALTILADDLTGAADCAGEAARRGLRTVVVFGPPGSGPVPDADVVAYDLDVRNATVEAATTAVRDATPWEAPVYLKVDSTLRGHVAAMVDAAMRAGGAPLAVVAPAFPALGRTTRGGHHQTADGSLDVDLPALLEPTGRPVERAARDALHAGAVISPARGGIVVCDAETEDDLDHVARDLAVTRPLWVGSAGLAAALVRTGRVGVPSQARHTADTGWSRSSTSEVDNLDHPPGATHAADARPAAADAPRAAAPVLTVAGSFAVETREQLLELLGAPGTAGVAVDPELLASDAPDPEVDRAAALLREQLAAGAHPVLHVGTDPEALASLRGSGGAHVRARSLRIAAGLGRIVAAAELPGGAGLVLTGGETARAVCDAIGVHGVELDGEVEAGIPRGRALGRDVTLVTKAGAFGSPATLLTVLHDLEGR